MFVITTIFGCMLRNDLLYSHASTTKYSLLPAIKLLSAWPTVASGGNNKLPTITVGSFLLLHKIFAIIAVVVVLPCVPATAMVYLSRLIISSICGYESAGIFVCFLILLAS